MKNLFKCQEKIIIQDEYNQTIFAIKYIINVYNVGYQDKQIQVFLNKKEGNQKKISKKAAKKYSKLFSKFINPSKIMKHQKLLNLLNEADSKFVTRK